jgi:hypothetical protein
MTRPPSDAWRPEFLILTLDFRATPCELVTVLATLLTSGPPPAGRGCRAMRCSLLGSSAWGLRCSRRGVWNTLCAQLLELYLVAGVFSVLRKKAALSINT